MSEETPPIGVINLGNKEISEADEAGYRERIRAAKAGSPLSSLKGGVKVGGPVERPHMPVLQRRAGGEPVSAPQGVTPRPPGSPVMRPETKEMVDKAVAAGAQAEQAGAQKNLDEEKLKEDARLAEIFEGFDFGNQAAQVERILDNKKRRTEIESRCQSMSFEDLLMKDEVQQRVPIIPGQFEPLFRSLRPVESLYLKSLMAKETVSSSQYMGEKYNLLLLTCSLVDINGVAFPDHRKHNGDGTFEVDDKLFEAKLKRVMQKSGYIIADLGVNYMWFDIRVRRLINPDDLKNG